MINMNLLGKSVLELKELIDKKEITSDEVWNFFDKRIEKYNETFNIYVTRGDRGEKGNKGATNDKGDTTLPIAVKDNFCTEGLKTTASSKLLENFIPPYSATVIHKLAANNMSVLGKTNMDAWAHGSSTETSDFGPTKNPWDINRVPGGSSGGSAAAVASYLAPASIGTETAGSIRLPAAWCGVVGLKPTYGRVSRYGVIAMGSSLDCPGPMTTTVKDAAYLLSKIAGKDPFDATTNEKEVIDYVHSIDTIKKMTIGICDDYLDGVSDDIKETFEKNIDLLKKAGHTIKKISLLPPKYSISVYTIIQRAEVSSNLARYDGVRFGDNRTTLGAEAKRRIMLGTYVLSHGYYDAFYKKALKVRTMIIEDFNKAFQDVDVIVAPTTPTTALNIGDWEKYPFFGEVMDVLNEPAAIAGLPAISIPSGLDTHNLPIGLQIVGKQFDEMSILQLAHQFEKETDFFGIIKKGFEKYE